MKKKAKNDLMDAALEKILRDVEENVLVLYDWNGVDDDIRKAVKAYAAEQMMEWRLWAIQPPTIFRGYESFNDVLNTIALNTYASVGLVPSSLREVMPEWLDYACQQGHDDLAVQLMSDGVDPFVHAPGCKSAATYIKKWRADMPKSWAWLCCHELAKKAAKARKRSWASGALVEPRAL